MDLSPDWWIAMVAAMALFWGGVIVVSILVLRSITREHNPALETAVEALDRRLARGEISPDEYRRRRDALEPQPQH